MRHEKAARLLDLARMLASSAEGMTLDEMAQALDVGRRTAERMRDAVWAAFPQMEVVEDPPTRRFRIPAGLDGLFQTPTAEELAALRTAADSYKSSGADGRARRSMPWSASCCRPCAARRGARWRPTSRPWSRPRPSASMPDLDPMRTKRCWAPFAWRSRG
jgi:predicted DNA-binding transcriptional regulator YafY